MSKITSESLVEDDDIKVELVAFLGSDFAQSISSELGSDSLITKAFLRGYTACLGNVQEGLKRVSDKGFYVPPKADLEMKGEG